MKKQFILGTIVAVAMMAMPQASQARESEIWWGVGGLAVGSVLGYNAGRHQTYREDRYYHGERPGRYYESRRPSSYYRGSYVYRERRVWPFYRYTESYPVITRTVPYGNAQAVSVTDLNLSRDAEETTPESAGEVNITIGDNNSDVSIVVGGAAQKTEEETRTVTVPSGVNNSSKRVVEVQVPVDASEEKNTDE